MLLGSSLATAQTTGGEDAMRVRDAVPLLPRDELDPSGRLWTAGDGREARLYVRHSVYDPRADHGEVECDGTVTLWAHTETEGHRQLREWHGCGSHPMIRLTAQGFAIVEHCYGSWEDPPWCEVARLVWPEQTSSPIVSDEYFYRDDRTRRAPAWVTAPGPRDAIDAATEAFTRALADQDLAAANRQLGVLQGLHAPRTEIDRAQARLRRIEMQRAREQARRRAREAAERERTRAETERHARAAQDFYGAISCSVWSMSGELTGHTQAYVPNLPSQQLARFARGRAYSGSMFMTSPLGQRLPGRYYVFYGGDGVRLALVIGEAELMYEVRRVAGPRGRRTITLWEQNSASTGVLREDRVRSRAAAESLPDRCPVRGP